MYRWYSALLLGVVTGCTRMPPVEDGFVPCTIAKRIGKEVEWCPEGYIQETIECLREGCLSAEGAIQIALLNNPKVQATFEELGIARADWVEAGLLSNPAFAIEVRYPHVSGLHTNIEYLITASLLDIFLIPLRTRVAKSEYEQVKRKVADELLHLAFDVRETYYALVAEKKKVQYLESIAELTCIMKDIASHQIAVGNINTLEWQLTEARFLEAELEWVKVKNEVIRLDEKMHRLLGFCNEVCLCLPSELPNIDYCGFDLCALECVALEERLDLQAARWEITRLCQMLGLKEWWTYTNVQAGLAGEREVSGINVLGPGFAGSLPIFNYGQADRMRLRAKLRQATDRLYEMEIGALSEVREAHKLLMNDVQMIQEYKLRLLPLQSAIVQSSESLYNVMGLGIDQLLENKLEEVAAMQHYTDSLKHYLITRVELDRALGGYLYKLLECPP